MLFSLCALIGSVCAKSTIIEAEVSSDDHDHPVYGNLKRRGIDIDYSEDESSEDDITGVALTLSDDREIEGLKGGQEMFSDYCISARGFVSREIDKSLNKAAVEIFRFFFKGAEDVAASVLEAQRMAVDRLSNQLLDPDQQIDQRVNSPLSEKIVVEGQRQIQEGKMQRHLVAFISTLGAMGAELVTKLQQSIVNSTTSAGPGLVQNLESGCLVFLELHRMLKKKFEKVRAELAETDPELAKVTYAQLNCHTPKRVSRIDMICKFVRLVKDSGLVKQQEEASKSGD